MAATTDTRATAGQQPADLTDRLRQALASLSNQQKVALLIASAALIALIVGTVIWSRQGDFRVLFSNLNERDGGAIIAALDQLQVPYKFTEGSGAILVPADKVHEARLRLASQGLPKGGAVGFELLENQKFGVSQFAEQVNYQRGLEGELSRTIQSIAAVQAARVHLAIPKPSVFIREEQKPTASVLVNLYPGRALEPSQVAGIVHLVASSVPQLPTANVAVIDQNGNLVSQFKSKLYESGLDPAQIKYVQEVEGSVIKRIEDILAPVVGPGNARVQVAADVDFSHSEQTAESYKPNTTPPDISIRSQQTSESASVAQGAGGVPGALSNQPPTQATAPIVAPAAPARPQPPGAPAQQGPGSVSAAGINAPLANAPQPVATRKDSTVNYEVDKTIRYTKSSLGAVRRLSVAVVVNHHRETGKDGKPVLKPLSEAEMKQINDLVRETMGFTKERGDSLSVANVPFNLGEKPAEVETPFWKQPETLSTGKDLIKYLAIAGIALYLFFGVIRPLLQRMAQASSERGRRLAATTIGGDEEIGEAMQPPAAFENKLQQARDFAQSDPKAVANIIKDWLGANAG